MSRVVTHLRRNVVAYIALFVALGGTSYAAVSVANHSLVPQKFNPKYIGGYVRAWASVNAQGQVISSSGNVRVGVDPFITGHYIVRWRPRPASRCASVGNVGIQNTPAPGYLTVEASVDPTRGEISVVQTYNPQGQPAAFPFTVVLLCKTPQ